MREGSSILRRGGERIQQKSSLGLSQYGGGNARGVINFETRKRLRQARREEEAGRRTGQCHQNENPLIKGWREQISAAREAHGSAHGSVQKQARRCTEVGACGSSPNRSFVRLLLICLQRCAAICNVLPINYLPLLLILYMD